MKKWQLSLILVLTALVVVGCGKKDAATSTKKEATVIRVGTSPGPYSELFLEAIAPILEKEGYTIKETSFSELLQADVALTEGAIDVNVDQHTAYLTNFNDNKSATLVGITAIPTVPAGLFPARKKTLAEVSEGDIIGIPDDPSNTARAFNILAKAKLITLKSGIDPIQATLKDVVDNPHNLEIVQMSSAQIPRSLPDLDYAVIPGSIVYSADLNAADQLLAEDVLKDYELVATVEKKNQDSDWAKAIVAAYRSDAFKSYLDKHNKDGYWFVPEALR